MAFPFETLIPVSISDALETKSTLSQNSQLNSQKERTPHQILDLNTHNGETVNSESVKDDTQEVNTMKEETRDSNERQEGEIVVLDGQIEENPGVYGAEDLDIDDGGSILEGRRSFSVHYFFREVFRKEVGEGGSGGHKLLILAVHAILLESGFVGFDSVSRMKFEELHIPDELPSSPFTVSLWYTLPQITDQKNAVDTVLLNFRSLGKYVSVYGSLAKNGSGTYSVLLDGDRLVFLLNIAWANFSSMEKINGNDGFSHVHPDRELFDFWKTIKDRLALPLLIDLCEKAGLAGPPSFMTLPSDLKLKIIEGLSGVDVAKVGCVCSQLHYLSLNDDLWEQKFEEQFGNVQESHKGTNWKEKFALSWETLKRRIAISEGLLHVKNGPYNFPPRFITEFDPFTLPRIIGGDYDTGLASPPGWSIRSTTRRTVIPHCDLGARHA